jgi:uncharacterized protein YwgA
MKLSEVILTALYAHDGPLVGRTRLQKVMYFLCERLDIDAAYFPHYYGPYSEEVAGAMDSLVARGLVEEEAEPAATGGPFEGKLYKYSIEEDGGELVEMIEEVDPADAKRVREHLADLLSDNPSMHALAIASKLHILLPDGVSVSNEKLRANAENLGWNLTPAQVREGIDFLVGKGFAEPD